jgi:hypothetical protein
MLPGIRSFLRKTNVSDRGQEENKGPPRGRPFSEGRFATVGEAEGLFKRHVHDNSAVDLAFVHALENVIDIFHAFRGDDGFHLSLAGEREGIVPVVPAMWLQRWNAGNRSGRLSQFRRLLLRGYRGEAIGPWRLRQRRATLWSSPEEQDAGTGPHWFHIGRRLPSIRWRRPMGEGGTR